MKVIHLIKALILSSFAILLIEACSDIRTLENRELVNTEITEGSQIPKELTKVDWSKLPGWQSDNLQGALAAFRNSLPILNQKNSNRWREIANAIDFVVEDDAQEVRGFFESHFDVYEITAFRGQVAVNSFSYENARGASISYNKMGEHKYPIGISNFAREVYTNDPIVRYFGNIQGNMVFKNADSVDRALSFLKFDGNRIGNYDLNQWKGDNPSKIHRANVSRSELRTWWENDRDIADSFFLRKDLKRLSFKYEAGFSGDQRHNDVRLTPRRSIAVDPKIREYVNPHGIIFLSGETRKDLNRLYVIQNSVTSLEGKPTCNIFAGGTPEDTTWANRINIKDKSIYIILPKGYFN